MSFFNIFKDIIIEMRPKQWYKNLLLFIGIIFSMNIFNINLLINTILGFILFCLLSGSIYIINDVLDAKEDRLHPVKRNRPIASGRLNSGLAILVSVILIIVTFVSSLCLGSGFTVIALLYFCLTILYNVLFKKLYLIDVLTISVGLVLRAVAGCIAIGVMISPWLILCTFLMALFLAFSKRRNELLILGDGAKDHRTILDNYSVASLDLMISISVSCLIVCYSIYTFFSGHMYMMLTIPFALYGIFRYTDSIINKGFGGEPELIFKDTGMVLNILLWCILVILVLLRVPEMIISFIMV